MLDIIITNSYILFCIASKRGIMHSYIIKLYVYYLLCEIHYHF